MYVTRPLSLYRNFPSTRYTRPSEAPYSGYLVITDEKSQEQNAFCWGLCNSDRVKRLPFPQDKILKVVHSSEYGEKYVIRFWFIPVLNKPLSSNCYYVIKAEGEHRGQACICSIEDDVAATCCFSSTTIMDVETRPFDHRDMYQQLEICQSHNGGFYAKSVTGDLYAPMFLRRKGWQVQISNSLKLGLREAHGIDASHLLNLPETNLPPSHGLTTPNTIAKWYCPFVFVKEKGRARNRMGKSLFYELSLEKWWEQIYSCENANEGDGNTTGTIRAIVQREEALVYGMDAKKDDRHGGDCFVWFRIKELMNRRRGVGIGLSLAIIRKMKWLLERRGWVDRGQKRDIVRMERAEEIPSESEWQRFTCHVMVWGFVLRRIDGNVVLNYNVRHTQNVQCRWE